MEQQIMGLLENWIISWLFVAIILWVVWKAFPYFAKKFDEMQNTHRWEMRELQASFKNSYDEQRATFEKTMDKVVVTFNAQIVKSNDWHEKHSNSLNEIRDVLRNIGK